MCIRDSLGTVGPNNGLHLVGNFAKRLVARDNFELTLVVFLQGVGQAVDVYKRQSLPTCANIISNALASDVVLTYSPVNVPIPSCVRSV